VFGGGVFGFLGLGVVVGGWSFEFVEVGGDVEFVAGFVVAVL